MTMPKKPKVTFEYGHMVVKQFDHDGTMATFTGPGAGSAGNRHRISIGKTDHNQLSSRA